MIDPPKAAYCCSIPTTARGNPSIFYILPTPTCIATKNAILGDAIGDNRHASRRRDCRRAACIAQYL
jgi:hypothetical protein